MAIEIVADAAEQSAVCRACTGERDHQRESARHLAVLAPHHARVRRRDGYQLEEPKAQKPPAAVRAGPLRAEVVKLDRSSGAPILSDRVDKLAITKANYPVSAQKKCSITILQQSGDSANTGSNSQSRAMVNTNFQSPRLSRGLPRVKKSQFPTIQSRRARDFHKFLFFVDDQKNPRPTQGPTSSNIDRLARRPPHEADLPRRASRPNDKTRQRLAGGRPDEIVWLKCDREPEACLRQS